jgi:hypothetical protein
MRKRAFLVGVILAALGIVALVTADQATAFNDYMDTINFPTVYPPTTQSAGGWTVTLVGGAPAEINESINGTTVTRYKWHYRVYKTSSAPTYSAAGLAFVALLIPNCYNCGCGDFSPACPQAITSWVAPIGKVCLAGAYCDGNATGFSRVFNVGVGEHRFNFGHDILEGYVVKGWSALDTDDCDFFKCPAAIPVDWTLVTDTKLPTTTTILLRTVAQEIPMLIAGPGCGSPVQASAPAQTFKTDSGTFIVQTDPLTGCYAAIGCVPPNITVTQDIITSCQSGSCPYPCGPAARLDSYLTMEANSTKPKPVRTLSNPEASCAYAVTKPRGQCPAFLSNEPFPGISPPTGTVYTLPSTFTCQ